MYCPMQLDCKSMTGVIHNCPNLKQCLENSPLDRQEAFRLYFLNLNINPEDIDIYVDLPDASFLFSSFSPRQQFNYNRDYRTRDTIIFGQPIDWQNGRTGGISYFYTLTVEQLQSLIEQRFADPEDRQNSSPTIAEFLAFAQAQKSRGFDFTFAGYAVSPSREDYRVSVDAIEWRGDVGHPVISTFETFAEDADELELSSNFLRAWWD